LAKERVGHGAGGRLSWSAPGPTFTTAAGEAGLAREDGGIDRCHADGFNLGCAVGTSTRTKAQPDLLGIAAG
jgi:hypothetical protein